MKLGTSYKRTYIRTYIHAYVPEYIRTYKHTFIHIPTYIRNGGEVRLPLNFVDKMVCQSVA